MAGGNAGIALLSGCELFNPTSSTWSATGDLNDARFGFGAALLGNGKVLATGGTSFGSTVLNTAEVYDPATGSWNLTGSMNDAGRGFGLAVISSSYSVTKVLRAGGRGYAGQYLSIAEIYNSSTGQWTLTTSMGGARAGFGLARLPNGNLFAAGGEYGVQVLSTAEEYNISAGTWASRPSMNSARTGFGLLLLPTEGVLIAMGGKTAGGGITSTAERYTP